MAGRKIEGGSEFQFSGRRHGLEYFDLLRMHVLRMAGAHGPDKAKELKIKESNRGTMKIPHGGDEFATKKISRSGREAPGAAGSPKALKFKIQGLTPTG